MLTLLVALAGCWLQPWTLWWPGSVILTVLKVVAAVSLTDAESVDDAVDDV
jgi:hypothetical protein